MIIDAQEFINELKTYDHYSKKRKKAIERYNEIELSLSRLEEYHSPSINTVEVTKFRNGKLVYETIPVPKLDPDPGRKERIRMELINQQLDIQDKIDFYTAKIERIHKISDMLPEKLRKQCWEVYVKHNVGRVSWELGTTKENVYRTIKEQLDDRMSTTKF